MSYYLYSYYLYSLVGNYVKVISKPSNQRMRAVNIARFLPEHLCFFQAEDLDPQAL